MIEINWDDWDEEEINKDDYLFFIVTNEMGKSYLVYVDENGNIVFYGFGRYNINILKRYTVGYLTDNIISGKGKVSDIIKIKKKIGIEKTLTLGLDLSLEELKNNLDKYKISRHIIDSEFRWKKIR